LPLHRHKSPVPLRRCNRHYDCHLDWGAAALLLHNDVYVKFGFLHMLSVSMLLCLPFLRFGKWNILPGIIVVLLGIFVIPEITAPEWLYPLGIHGADFLDTTQDYFPLFPWFGVLLIGIALGDIFYPNGIRVSGFRMREKSGSSLPVWATAK
ncbi:MAG TPA: heparan-alpha-glucosaminide N-acetyltransferase domain-containing protein, partial [Methanocorpusculum sp.]|nr:heparan-alpha-glucosaminide N-acetyltransferase domain-containing protein [Methanocorpusculum sp.]